MPRHILNSTTSAVQAIVYLYAAGDIILSTDHKASTSDFFCHIFDKLSLYLTCFSCMNRNYDM